METWKGGEAQRWKGGKGAKVERCEGGAVERGKCRKLRGWKLAKVAKVGM